MVEIVDAEEFHDFQTKGYSRPARVSCRRADGELVELFIKFAGGVRGHNFGLCSELICSLLATELGLLTPTPFTVNLSKDFLTGVPLVAKDLVERSLGLNFGSKNAGFGYHAMPTNPKLKHELRQVAAEIFAFDILTQNFDRKSDNPNLLWNGSKIILIDHESALQSVVEKDTPGVASLELDRFYDHVFFNILNPGDAVYDRLSGKLASVSIDNIFNQIPSQWSDNSALKKVRSHLDWVIANNQTVCNLIEERIA